MNQLRESIAKNRSHTDASLGVERASADAATDKLAVALQRVADDLVERDRIRADEHLLTFRQKADGILARERSASPPRDSSVAIERQVADEDKKAEREVTDALLDSERQKADAVTETGRREHHADRASMEVQRQDTNDQLSTERHDLDVAATALFETKGALAHSLGEHERGRDVLGMVAHDLRSPLSVIAMNSENIAETTQEDLTRDAATDTIRAAARMDRIVTDLLDVVRIESGTLQIVKRPHDVAKLVSEVRNTYEPLFARRGLTFKAPSPGPGLVASFDRDRVIQVLSNLLGNAMKFTRSGGIIDLHVESRTGQIEFALHDDGPGIPAAALTEIFKRFSQLGGQERRGLGLGLYICEQLVVGHGGRIWAESEPGKGATFRFTLPT